MGARHERGEGGGAMKCDCDACVLLAELGIEAPEDPTAEQEAAMRLALVAATPREHATASVMMRAAFPEIAAAYSDEEPS